MLIFLINVLDLSYVVYFLVLFFYEENFRSDNFQLKHFDVKTLKTSQYFT